MSLEQLLTLAVSDPVLARRLEQDPDDAAQSANVTLLPSERRMLAALNPGQLQRVLDGVRVTRNSRRAFIGGATASVVTLLGACDKHENRSRRQNMRLHSLGIRPAIATPRRRLVVTVGSTKRGELSRQQLTFLNQHIATLGDCYLARVGDDLQRPPLTVTLTLSIRAEGAVQRAAAEIASLVDERFHALGPCIERLVKSWRFPPSTSKVQVELPVIFRLERA